MTEAGSLIFQPETQEATDQSLVFLEDDFMRFEAVVGSIVGACTIDFAFRNPPVGGEVAFQIFPDSLLFEISSQSCLSFDGLEGVIFVKKKAGWKLSGSMDLHHHPKPRQPSSVFSCGTRRSGSRHS